MTARPPILLALDVGLTNVKAVAFDQGGAVRSNATVPYCTLHDGDTVVQEPEDWWAALCSASLALPDAVRRSVAGVAVTAHMHTLVALDGHGRSLGPALILGDRRAVPDASAITRDVGAGEVYRITGAELDASMPAAKARWMRREQADAWRAMRHLLGCKDALRFRMTGELATDPIDACATSLYDIGRKGWSDTMLEAAGVSAAQLPAIADPCAVAGTLLPGPAAELGLPVATPVAVGAGDDVVLLGMGILEPGVAMEHIGTTGSIMAAASDRPDDPLRALEIYPHVLEDLWVLGGSHTTAGSALAWAATTLGYPSVAEALGALELERQTDVTFVPTLAGRRFPDRDPLARGSWTGFDLGTTRDDLMSATFCGVADALASVLRRIESVADPVVAVRASHAETEAWLRLREAAYGRPIEVSLADEPTALGTAMLVAVAIGLYADVREAVREMAPRVLNRSGALA